MWSEFSSDTASNNRALGRLTLDSVASDYVARGWPVIPLLGKLPAVSSWKEYQSRLPTSAEIETWFVTGESLPTGIGIVTGKLSGLVVVDCDSLHDAVFWREYYPSSPLVVETGGGGVHFYYALSTDCEVRNRAGVLGRKIDVRGEGGYAAAPPSIHQSGKHYVWQAGHAFAMLPNFDTAWLIDKSQPARLPTSVLTGKVRNAVAYIRRIQATAGEGGHNATFRAACKLRDAGLSEDEALTVLSDWNETNAFPPWSATDLIHKIRSAFDALTR